jgi:hypothetical protein
VTAPLYKNNFLSAEKSRNIKESNLIMPAQVSYVAPVKPLNFFLSFIAGASSAREWANI